MHRAGTIDKKRFFDYMYCMSDFREQIEAMRAMQADTALRHGEREAERKTDLAKKSEQAGKLQSWSLVLAKEAVAKSVRPEFTVQRTLAHSGLFKKTFQTSVIDTGWLVTQQVSVYDPDVNTKTSNSPIQYTSRGIALLASGDLASYTAPGYEGSDLIVQEDSGSPFFRKLTDLTEHDAILERTHYWTHGAIGKSGLNALESHLVAFALKHTLDV
jgi:hypothetical protein